MHKPLVYVRKKNNKTSWSKQIDLTLKINRNHKDLKVRKCFNLITTHQQIVSTAFR